MISCAVTAQLICVFVFAYANCWFSHAQAQLRKYGVTESSISLNDLKLIFYVQIIPLFRNIIVIKKSVHVLLFVPCVLIWESKHYLCFNLQPPKHAFVTEFTFVHIFTLLSVMLTTFPGNNDAFFPLQRIPDTKAVKRYIKHQYLCHHR